MFNSFIGRINSVSSDCIDMSFIRKYGNKMLKAIVRWFVCSSNLILIFKFFQRYFPNLPPDKIVACWIIIMFLLSSSDFFSKTDFFKTFFQEYYQSAKQCSLHQDYVLSVLIWVQTVCKGCQQTTKVAASQEDVRHYKTNNNFKQILMFNYY